MAYYGPVTSTESGRILQNIRQKSHWSKLKPLYNVNNLGFNSEKKLWALIWSHTTTDVASQNQTQWEGEQSLYGKGLGRKLQESGNSMPKLSISSKRNAELFFQTPNARDLARQAGVLNP